MRMHRVLARRGIAASVLLISTFIVSPSPASAQGEADPYAELQTLREEVEELRRRDEENRRRIEKLADALQRLTEQSDAAAAQVVPPAAPATAPVAAAAESRSAEDALDAALQEAEPPAAEALNQPIAGTLWSRQLGNVQLQLLDLSTDILFAAGGSTVGDSELDLLEAGAHDPNRNGFTLQGIEIGLQGAVDPYFRGDVFLNASTEGVELEEGFITTTSLPWQLQLEAGLSLAEFGVINPRHAHQWEWIDQPVINARLFGPEGLRSEGFRLSWLTPLSWPSELMFGIQNANNEDLTVSFISGEPVGGRPSVDDAVDGPADLLYLARWVNTWQYGPAWTNVLGLSGLFGPNDTGSDSRTYIYGLDYRLKWLPTNNFRGYPFVLWQTEIMKRDFEAEAFVAEPGGNDLGSETLHDWGGYSQILWGFRLNWQLGFRLEYANGSGDSVDEDGLLVSHNTDPGRDQRWRLGPLLTWWPTHFSRLRLQYNYDRAKFLPSDYAHTVWLGMEAFFGAHPAHTY